MVDSPQLTARVLALEMRLTHQDRAIEDLNEIVTRQWREMERLKRLVDRLEAEIAEAEAGRRDLPGKEPPPPHY
ncbi:SlyX protein [Devosia enhydra]|uniref:Protein SlyX homolog n=1 Tax=Devosia enhydra TaxID=665118 RepID=A0A1K2HVT2_9HYPH|nr:SlyX family protein [Devosia enhydra]SFZ82885.1 SlyX protein [Devosia enhydra]